ncbi:polysaccharide biosynthesis C-terminal domain-containing protein [Candidatus Symbiopectobacterium sp. NZEC135]|uniref:polysaccharide biosynthesis C-terminal domain-containing protein n=1 Tax=Candidatus Symbiopectobacterium sp. NZEC135 TaxID=2820471 RepID=UPI00222622A0|nr:polysaccharide biosynthesis C-terminal domain-containing protein [Candidatus Symbiopectobacterium sp. NZEC135]MCW2481600.1 polysaccharide biosynthesis C-terminal domain-containing protein [Candidatus Symbiopectobacterium sp. NZEC135]
MFIKNTLLLSIERISRAGIAFLISFMLTKYYGIDIYGMYAYYIAMLNIICVSFSLGLDDYFIKEVAEGKKIPYFFFFIRILLLFLSFMTMSVFLYLKEPPDDFFVIVLMTLTYIWNLFYLLLAIENIKNKAWVVFNIILISAFSFIIKYVFIEYGILVFIIISFLEGVFLNIYLYLSVKSFFSFTEHKTWFDFYNVLKKSIPVGLAALSIILFYRVDQLIIEFYLGNIQLGIYALASSILLALGYLQSSFVTSMYGKLGKANKNDDLLMKELRFAYSGAIIVGIICCICYLFPGRYLLQKIIPEHSHNIIELLNIGVFSIFFSGFGAINAQYLFLRGMVGARLLRTVFAVIFNVCWNLILIPFYGTKSAIWGFLITQVFMGVVFNIVDKNTRMLIKCQFYSIFIWKK